MRIIRSAILYTALVLGANAALADPALEALREDSLKKLTFHSAPKEVSDVAFLDETGAEITLQDLKGKYLLVNFWATWCAPCRHEMPGLNELQTELGGESFEVVTIATGRNPEAGIRRFFEEVGVDALPKYRDPTQKLARGMAVLGLPITVLLNPEGQEIARLLGDAEWNSDSAKAIIQTLSAGG